MFLSGHRMLVVLRIDPPLYATDAIIYSGLGMLEGKDAEFNGSTFSWQLYIPLEYTGPLVLTPMVVEGKLPAESRPGQVDPCPARTERRTQAQSRRVRDGPALFPVFGGRTRLPAQSGTLHGHSPDTIGPRSNAGKADVAGSHRDGQPKIS